MKTKYLLEDNAAVLTTYDAQMEMRACVTNADYSAFLTWYRNCDVVWWNHEPDSDKIIGQAYTLAEFNKLAVAHGFKPVGFGRRGKQSSSVYSIEE